MADLAYMSKNSSPKHKIYVIATSKDECYKYHKIRHFKRDCKFPNYQFQKKNSGNNTKQN